MPRKTKPVIYVFAHMTFPETGIAFCGYDRGLIITGSVNPFGPRRNSFQTHLVIRTTQEHIERGYRLVTDQDRIGRNSPLPEQTRKYLLSQLNHSKRRR